MQTHTQTFGRFKTTRTVVISFVMSLPGLSQAEDIGNLAMLDSAEQWQMNRLLEPTDRQRKQEVLGKVMIYDSVSDKAIDMALDTNFHRIENMMFVRIIQTDSNGIALKDKHGKKVLEDDGC